MSFASRKMVTATLVVMLLAACTTTPKATESPVSEVLFVCEHGNVKSLMAASYFNQLAQERGLPFRGVARGSAPDSTTVPPPIIAGLRADGFEVSAFHPAAVTAADVSTARRVIAISTALPASTGAAGTTVESWSDVPPASVDYDAARASLKQHVAALISDLQAQ